MRRLSLPGALCFLAAAGYAQAPVHKRAAVPGYQELKYPPLKPIQIPEVASFTLPNGMKLYLLEDHELPLVRGFALVRTGNLFDPADKVGLATMTGITMRSGGTKTKTGDQLDEQLENMAASVESQILESYGEVSFSALKDNTSEVLEVFRDLLTAPEFREDKIDLAKTELNGGISRRNDDPHGIAAREFADLVYGPKTPYGWQIEYATVDHITRDDLAAFYKRYFFPANIMLAIAGDFSTAGMKAQLEKLFEGWTAVQAPVPPFPPVAAKPAPGVFFASKPDVTQTFFNIGHLGGTLRDKDFPALEVMADILGGGFRSRLFQRVRTQMGDAYNISASWAADYDHPGLFEIAGSTKSFSTVDALKAIREEVEKIRTTEVSDDELKTAKDTVVNGYVFHFDTRAKTLERLIVYQYYGYPRDFIDQYEKAVQSVTKADVLRAAREHLDPKDFTIVAVGNQEQFGQPLASLGLTVAPIDLTIPEAKPQTAASANPESIERGKRLLQKVQQAAGGAAKLASVKDMVRDVEMHVDPSAGGIVVKQTDRWIAPDYFRQDNQLPFGHMAIYSVAKDGWLSSPQGTTPLPAAQLKQVQSELFRMWFPMLLSDRDPDRSISSPADGVVEISDKQGDDVKLFLDSSTSLPQKATYQMSQPGGPPTIIEETFADYREVDGIKLPFRITLTPNGKKYADVVVLSQKLNSGLKPEDLSRKP